MKSYSVDKTLNQLRDMPEEISFEEVAAFVASAPLVLGAGIGLAKILIHFTHTKYFIPMILGGSTTVGLALWLGVHSFSPETGSSSPSPKTQEDPKESTVDFRKDSPYGGLTLVPDSSQKKKRVVRREEIRIRKGDSDSADFTLPPLPELPPLPPVPGSAPMPPDAKGRKVEIRKEIKEIRGEDPDKSRKEKDEKDCGEDDAFIRKMVDYLHKENLLKDRNQYTLELKPNSLWVDGKDAGRDRLEKVLSIFRKVEKKKFGGESLLSITRQKKSCSISKHIEE